MEELVEDKKKRIQPKNYGISFRQKFNYIRPDVLDFSIFNIDEEIVDRLTTELEKESVYKKLGCKCVLHEMFSIVNRKSKLPYMRYDLYKNIDILDLLHKCSEHFYSRELRGKSRFLFCFGDNQAKRNLIRKLFQIIHKGTLFND